MFGRKVRHYDSIPEEFEQAILELAKQHPALGQDALQGEVERLGITPDPHELKLFLRDHNIPPKRRPIYSNRSQRAWSPVFLLWGARNPVGPIGSDVTIYSTGFPYYWGWMNHQPLWFRLIALLPPLAAIVLGGIAVFVR